VQFRCREGGVREAEEKDMESEEMARRFGEFKRCVFHVHQVNIAHLSYKLGLNQFADGELPENFDSESESYVAKRILMWHQLQRRRDRTVRFLEQEWEDEVERKSIH
jgi:hypothetical protein